MTSLTHPTIQAHLTVLGVSTAILFLVITTLRHRATAPRRQAPDTLQANDYQEIERILRQTEARARNLRLNPHRLPWRPRNDQNQLIVAPPRTIIPFDTNQLGQRPFRPTQGSPLSPALFLQLNQRTLNQVVERWSTLRDPQSNLALRLYIPRRNQQPRTIRIIQPYLVPSDDTDDDEPPPLEFDDPTALPQ